MCDSVRIIAGLGNPGPEYEDTRHNVGFQLVENLADRYGGTWRREGRFLAYCAGINVNGTKILLVKPYTFMNRSGDSLAALARYYNWPSSAFLVAFDEINLEPGRSKLGTSGSSGGHNGLANCLARLGEGFLRLRLGIGGRPDARIDLKDWVLGKFSPADQEAFQQALPRLFEGVETLLSKGATAATEIINRRKP
ncbi:MAG: aminoacyl-tRNA hydrolase [Puniceicoccaceae bacterium]